MNCNGYELLIAQSLDGEANAALDNHLATCQACRELKRELEADRAALAESDDIPELALSELHNRVMSRVPVRRSKAGLIWRIGVIAAAAAITIVLMRVPPRTQPQSIPVPPAIAKITPRPQPPPPAVKPKPQPKQLPHRRPKTSEGPPLMVKLETSDPNVVIYWMVDRNNGELE